MIASHVNEWISLILRFSHLIVGIAWIGASFYFNWLENRLERDASGESPLEGDLWAIHGGGFYHVQKFRVAPDQLPPVLHWFKWEAYATWFTGLALLTLLYYVDARVYLVDPSVADLSPLAASLIGVASIAVSWIAYDLLCRSPIGGRQRLVALIVFAYFCLLAFVLCQLFSGRGAFMHVGAAIGTIMVLNVMAVIIPSQRSLVQAMESGAEPDPGKGAAALTRSRHNNYFTLPVLFIMISGHAPMTYAGAWNWLNLIVIAIAGILIRHYFNVRHLRGSKWWLIAAGAGLLIALAAATLPRPVPTAQVSDDRADFDGLRQIVSLRCTTCHSANPVQTGFASPPAGLVLDTDDQIRSNAERIYTATAVTRTMPIANLSGMSERERAYVAQWYEQFVQNRASQ